MILGNNDFDRSTDRRQMIGTHYRSGYRRRELIYLAFSLLPVPSKIEKYFLSIQTIIAGIK